MPADSRDVGWMQDAAACGMGCLLTEQGQYGSPTLEETIQDSSGLWQGKVRSEQICPEKAPLKVTSGQSAESILGGGFLVQPEPMVGVQPPLLGCGAQQGQHAPSAQTGTSKESLNPSKSSHMGRGS